MTRKEIARRLVAEKAILDALSDANQETRDQAREEYEPGDADSVTQGGETFGRVRRDKPTTKRQVVDWQAVTRFAEEHCPHEILLTPSLNPAWVGAVCRTGEYITPDGEVLEVPGLGLVETPGKLVVTTTEVGRGWADGVLGGVLPELEAGHE